MNGHSFLPSFLPNFLYNKYCSCLASIDSSLCDDKHIFLLGEQSPQSIFSPSEKGKQRNEKRGRRKSRPNNQTYLSLWMQRDQSKDQIFAKNVRERSSCCITITSHVGDLSPWMLETTTRKGPSQKANPGRGTQDPVKLRSSPAPDFSITPVHKFQFLLQSTLLWIFCYMLLLQSSSPSSGQLPI